MTVSVAGTPMRAAIIGEVVDMPTPEIFLVKDDRTGNVVTVHDAEIFWFATRD